MHTIDIETIESEVKARYKKMAYAVVVANLLIAFSLHKDFFFATFFVPFFLFLPYIPNYFVLKAIYCPYCHDHYFKPHLASKNFFYEVKKSQPACINCNHRATLFYNIKKTDL